MGYEVRSSSNAHSPLLTLLLSILILLVTIDIYLSILSPNSCTVFSVAPHGVASSQESFDNNDNQEQLLIESIASNKLFDIKSYGSQTGITFREIKGLEDMDNTGDATWDNLSTPGGGYLYLSSNMSTSPREPWGVSMFHSLHCLRILRDTIQRLERQLNQSSSTQRNDEHHQHSHEEGVISPTHYKHCFAYIAQSIACAADGTLEAPHFHYYENGTFNTYTIDGEGTWHKCRDQSLLWKKVLESEEKPLEQWDHQVGDTVQSVWGDGQ